MRKVLFIGTILACVSCKMQDNNEYLVDEDGITAEKPHPQKSYEENYNDNNLIYKVGRKFTYRYYYEGLDGIKYQIREGKGIQKEDLIFQDFDFIPVGQESDETVTEIILKITAGNPFSDIPDYNQTMISYEYLKKNGDTFSMEITGAIENEKNVWIHPPRSTLFEILELNPFPYIKAPYKKGTIWTWTLGISDDWSDKRWLDWKGSIKNTYTYEIVGKEKLMTPLGKLECHVVKGTATSRLGDTYLTSYFNEKYGFVKLDYINIDGSKLFLNMEKAE